MKYCEIYIKILTFENVNRCKMYFLCERTDRNHLRVPKQQSLSELLNKSRHKTSVDSWGFQEIIAILPRKITAKYTYQAGSLFSGN